MAAGMLPKPGTQYGPCEAVKGANGIVLSCGHADCQASRIMAASICSLCGRPIGYETRYYRNGERGYDHAACREDAADRKAGA